MSTPQDLLALLNQANATASRAPRAATTSGNVETSILSFKAGKMQTTLKPNGKYLVEPDGRRGELHVVWKSSPASTTTGANAGGANGTLSIQWKDRRTKTTVNTISVFPEYDATYERVETGNEGDRVYLLTVGGDAEGRHFFWMQDKNSEPDEELCVKVNLYLSDLSEAASAAGANATTADTSAAADTAATDAADDAELLRIMQESLMTSQGLDAGGGARTATVPGEGSIPTANAGQVDALGNILESLGMPQANGTPAGEHTADSAAATANAGGGLTLDMLQGAMAGLATTSDGEGGGVETEGEGEGKEAEEAAPEADAKVEEEATSKDVAKEEAAEEPTTQTKLIILISNGVYDMVQASNQREALRTLDDFNIPYDTIDGMDPEMREKRNALFETSGIRGNYPQIFSKPADESESEDITGASYLGGYEWLNSTGIEDLKALFPSAGKSDAVSSSNGTAAETSDGETKGTRRLTILISNGVYDMVQASNQRDALRLLDDFNIPYDTIDGMDPDMREKRNSLFEISGIRGNYPQIFVSSEEEGGEDNYTYLGGHNWLHDMDIEELKNIVSK